MNKYSFVLFLLVFLLCHQSANGQVTIGARLEPRHGVVSSNLSPSHSVFAPSVQVGVVSQFHLHKIFAIQPEFTFTRTAIDFKPSTLESFAQRSFAGLNLLGNFFIPVSEKVSINLMLGPYFSIALDEGRFDNPFTLIPYEQYVATTYKTEFGFMGSAGASMALGSGRLALDVRFNRTSISYTSTGGEFYYTNLGLGLGYHFILGKKAHWLSNGIIVTLF